MKSSGDAMDSDSHCNGKRRREAGLDKENSRASPYEAEPYIIPIDSTVVSGRKKPISAEKKASMAGRLVKSPYYKPEYRDKLKVLALLEEKASSAEEQSPTPDAEE